MSIKIKVSYERPNELTEVLKLLSPVMQSHKLPKEQAGRYKKAYVLLKDEVGTKSKIERGKRVE